jgi:RHS repeat-associated protein
LAGDTSLTRYLYTAREFDPVTGLQYNRQRWYDSRTGRWLSEDPIGFAGDPSNLYRYVGASG